ncbi:unnamed protein product [Lupinus luteus]|uniref:Uncharacterized protein n=1 Tax=Lupinus luteus TaxID=3873 RepID=A0AAV1XHP2_LUPLU
MFFPSTYHHHQHDSSSNPYFTTFPSSSTYPNVNAANTLPCFSDPPPPPPPPHEVHDFATNTFLHDSLLGLLPFIPSTTTNQTQTHHHHHHHASFTEEAVANLAMLDNQQDTCNNNISSYGLLHQGISIPNLLTQKPAAAIAKRDRHSKIHTSQGLRDRRVRLSSDIARKFFDLQEMLDFDKPSNTLEWLFKKSENAIKELARSKHNNNNNNGLVDNNTSNEKPLSGSGGDSSNSSKGKKSKWAHRDQDICTTIQTKKESREKARARARERTCFNKMCNNSTWRLIEERSSCPAMSSNTPQYEANCARWPYYQTLKPYPSDTHHQLSSDGPFTLRDGYNAIEDSIMIKRNNMKPSMMMSSSHNQQNLVIPKEPRFNNNDDYQSLPYSTQNWDTSNGSSNFSGIATMNLSTFFMNQCSNNSSME